MHASFDLADLSKKTSGYSGSDLKELCRNAAMVPMREFMRSAGTHPELLAQAEDSVRLIFISPSELVNPSNVMLPQGFELRPLTIDDFFQSDGTSALPPSEDDFLSRLRA